MDGNSVQEFNVGIKTEISERSYFLNVYRNSTRKFPVSGNSTRPEPNRIGLARPSGDCEPYISATMRVTIMKQIPKDAHMSKFELIKFLNQSIGSSEREI